MRVSAVPGSRHQTLQSSGDCTFPNAPYIPDRRHQNPRNPRVSGGSVYGGSSKRFKRESNPAAEAASDPSPRRRPKGSSHGLSRPHCRQAAGAAPEVSIMIPQPLSAILSSNVYAPNQISTASRKARPVGWCHDEGTESRAYAAPEWAATDKNCWRWQ